MDVKSKKRTVLTDCIVTAEFDHGQFVGWGLSGSDRVEALARAAESRCREFNSFIRDHRSQDDIRLNVEKITEEQCSNCGRAWEVDYTEVPPTCAGCGAEVE